jgi:hypothetical protein
MMPTPTLFTYLDDVQTLLREQKQTQVDPADAIKWINRARREIALRTSCCRGITPIAGAVISASVTSGGTGYTAPTVTITPPDYPSGQRPFPNGAQATATAVLSAGKISSVLINYGGSGYYLPSATITDPTGTGATVTLATSYVSKLVQGQEVYLFSDIDLSSFPGLDSVYHVEAINILYAAQRYSLVVQSFSTYNALLRQFTNSYQYIPFFAAQLAQGTSGSLFLYPLPSAPWQAEMVFRALPSDLIDDQSVEAIPQPWTDGVAHFACYWGYLSLQNANMARMHLELFEKFNHGYSVAARPGRRPNPYGRPIG